MKGAFASLTALLLLSSGVALAAPTSDEALERMRSMKTIGQSLEMATIDQRGEIADAIRANLKRIKLPDGFGV